VDCGDDLVGASVVTGIEVEERDIEEVGAISVWNEGLRVDTRALCSSCCWGEWGVVMAGRTR